MLAVVSGRKDQPGWPSRHLHQVAAGRCRVGLPAGTQRGNTTAGAAPSCWHLLVAFSGMALVCTPAFRGASAAAAPCPAAHHAEEALGSSLRTASGQAAMSRGSQMMSTSSWLCCAGLILRRSRPGAGGGHGARRGPARGLQRGLAAGRLLCDAQPMRAELWQWCCGRARQQPGGTGLLTGGVVDVDGIEGAALEHQAHVPAPVRREGAQLWRHGVVVALRVSRALGWGAGAQGGALVAAQHRQQSGTLPASQFMQGRAARQAAGPAHLDIRVHCAPHVVPRHVPALGQAQHLLERLAQRLAALRHLHQLAELAHCRRGQGGPGGQAARGVGGVV